jgi:hypothetical protein
VRSDAADVNLMHFIGSASVSRLVDVASTLTSGSVVSASLVVPLTCVPTASLFDAETAELAVLANSVSPMLGAFCPELVGPELVGSELVGSELAGSGLAASLLDPLGVEASRPASELPCGAGSTSAQPHDTSAVVTVSRAVDVPVILRLCCTTVRS